MSKQRPPVVEASEVMGNGESVPPQQVAERFAKFLGIGAARLLAKGPLRAPLVGKKRVP